MPLFRRIWTAISVVNFIVLAIFVGLATVQFSTINAALIGERLIVLAETTAAPFEAAARIGLPLAAVRNAGAILERARQTDDAIVAIHVFDQTGAIVHSTDPSAPATIPVLASSARAVAAGGPWHRETEDAFFSGIDVAGRGGVSAGGIMIVYPHAGSVTQIQAMAGELAAVALFVLLAVAGLGALMMRIGLRRQIQVFAAIDNVIVGFERNAWRGAAGGATLREVVEEEEAAELAQLLEAGGHQYRAVGRDLAERQVAP